MLHNFEKEKVQLNDVYSPCNDSMVGSVVQGF